MPMSYTIIILNNNDSHNTPRVRSRSEDRRARPGGGSRSSDAPTATAGSLSDRSTTLRRPQNTARHVSPSAARSSALRAVSRILVTASGELILLPVGGRHPKLNLVGARLRGTVIGIGDCLGGKRENYQVCSVQYCAQ